MKSDKIVAYSFGASTHEICPTPLIKLNFDPGIRSQVSRTKSGGVERSSEPAIAIVGKRKLEVGV
jgi:hypothetical protein